MDNDLLVGSDPDPPGTSCEPTPVVPATSHPSLDLSLEVYDDNNVEPIRDNALFLDKGVQTAMSGMH